MFKRTWNFTDHFVFSRYRVTLGVNTPMFPVIVLIRFSIKKNVQKFIIKKKMNIEKFCFVNATSFASKQKYSYSSSNLCSKKCTSVNYYNILYCTNFIACYMIILLNLLDYYKNMCGFFIFANTYFF